MRPQLFFRDKAFAAAEKTHNPETFALTVVIRYRIAKFRPLGVIHPPGQDVDLDAHSRHGETDLFDIHQLSAEVGVFRPVRIPRIEITLRIEKRDPHQSATVTS